MQGGCWNLCRRYANLSRYSSAAWIRLARWEWVSLQTHPGPWHRTASDTSSSTSLCRLHICCYCRWLRRSECFPSSLPGGSPGPHPTTRPCWPWRSHSDTPCPDTWRPSSSWALEEYLDLSPPEPAASHSPRGCYWSSRYCQHIVQSQHSFHRRRLTYF